MILVANQTRGRSHRRRGFGLIEMAITGLLVAVALTATLKVVGWVALERRSNARRERAVREASNLMERISARPWDGLLTESLAALRLPDAALRSLPEGAVTAQVDPVPGAPSRKRITLEIRWIGRAGQPDAPVRLVAWADRPGGQP
jgi:hypothetical protein